MGVERPGRQSSGAGTAAGVRLKMFMFYLARFRVVKAAFD